MYHLVEPHVVGEHVDHAGRLEFGSGNYVEELGADGLDTVSLENDVKDGILHHMAFQCFMVKIFRLPRDL